MKKCEREKQQLQQSHSQHIQQLLDETSSRMTRLEQEYNSQAQESVSDLILLWNHNIIHMIYYTGSCDHWARVEIAATQ